MDPLLTYGVAETRGKTQVLRVHSQNGRAILSKSGVHNQTAFAGMASTSTEQTILS